MDEAFSEAQSILAVECPGVDLVAADVVAEFDAGAWFGIAACLTVLERHGYLRLVADGESRE